MSYTDEFLEWIKSGKVDVIFCEPLAEFYNNLRFCPNREECEYLADFLERDPFKAEDLIYDMHCWFCESQDWIIVAAGGGILQTLIVTPEFGKKVRDILEQKKEADVNG